jgi:hypothetical protein
MANQGSLRLADLLTTRILEGLKGDTPRRFALFLFVPSVRIRLARTGGVDYAMGQVYILVFEAGLIT